MRRVSFTATKRALRNGVFAVGLGALLVACGGSSEGDSAASGGGAGASGAGGMGAHAGSGSAAADAGTGGTADGGAGGDDEAGVDGGGADAGGGGGAGGFEAGSANVTCKPIVAGKSSLVVNGTSREFLVQLPSDTSHMALLFLWHGWQQDPAAFRDGVVYDVPSGKWVPFDPNAFPMPLMIVTPVDTGLFIPAGLDWDIVSGGKDFDYFEGMLQCIEQQLTIDTTRIYSLGFSAGAVFTNLLSAKYPHLFAATISESGAWFNDKAEWSDVLVNNAIPVVQWKWPDFVPADEGNVLLTHGGPKDFATIISLESANKKAVPFLYDNRRTVVECAHTFGHTLDPDLTQGMYYEYMWAHELGGSPLSSLPAGFPTQAKPVGATTCTLHGYP